MQITKTMLCLWLGIVGVHFASSQNITLLNPKFTDDFCSNASITAVVDPVSSTYTFDWEVNGEEVIKVGLNGHGSVMERVTNQSYRVIYPKTLMSQNSRFNSTLTFQFNSNLSCGSAKTIVSVVSTPLNIQAQIPCPSCNHQNCTNGRCFCGDHVNETCMVSGEIREGVCLFNGSITFNLDCPKAPCPVNLVGEFTVEEGKNFGFYCNYNDVYPIGNESIFFFNEKNFTLPKGAPFNLNPSRCDNNKNISCQALTDFTRNHDSNCSIPSFPLIVQYPPTPICNTSTCITPTCIIPTCITQICKNEIIVESGSKINLFFNFTANAEVLVSSLKKDDQTINISSMEIRKVCEFCYMYPHHIAKVSESDSGTYVLMLHTPNLTIPFHNITLTVTVTQPSQLSYLIIAVVILVILVMIVLLIAIVICIRRRRSLAAAQRSSEKFDDENVKEENSRIL